MARRESSTLRINVEIKDRDVAIFNARLGEMETKAGSASGAVDRTSGSIKKAGQSSAAAAVQFQTMTQGMLNLATTGAQVFTSMSNLDRAANRLAQAQVGLARAQDLYNNKEIRLQELRQRGQGQTEKAIQLEKELGTAKADLAVKTDKLRIEEGALNDVRILFATNIANVAISSIQTIKTMQDLLKTSTIALTLKTKILGSTFVQTGIMGKATAINMTMIGPAGVKAAAGVQLLTLRLRTLLVTLGPIAAGFVGLSIAYQAFEEDWGGFGTAMKNTFPFLRDLTALQNEAKDSIDNWAGANNELANTYDNMEGKAKKSLTKINQMQADFLKQQLSSQDRKNYEAYLDKIAEFGGGTPQGFTTGSSGLPEQSKGTIGNIPNVPSLLGGGILLAQQQKEKEGLTYKDILDKFNKKSAAEKEIEDYSTFKTPEANVPNFTREFNKIILSKHPELINKLSWRGTGTTGLEWVRGQSESLMQGSGYGQNKKAELEQFITNKMDQREHIMDFRGITNPAERMFVKKHGYIIRDGQRINFPEVMRMNAAIEFDIRELERINYLVPDQDYTPSDPTKLRDHFDTGPSTSRFLTGDKATPFELAVSMAHQPRRVFTERFNAMFGMTGSGYDTTIAERLLRKMSGEDVLSDYGTAREGSKNYLINKATGEIVTLPTGASGALAYAKAFERLSLEHGSAGAHALLTSGMRSYGLKSEAEQLDEHEARKKDVPFGASPDFWSTETMRQKYGRGEDTMDFVRQLLGGGEEVAQNQMFAYKQVTQNSINVVKINSDGKAYVSSTTTARANRAIASAQWLGRMTWYKEQNKNYTMSRGGSGKGIVNHYVKNAATEEDRQAMDSLAASHDSQVRQYAQEAFDLGRDIDILWLRKQTENQARALSASISARIAAEEAKATQFREAGLSSLSQQEALSILRDKAQGEQTLIDMLAYQQRLDAMSTGVVN